MTSNLKFLHLSDFTGGLNTYNPSSELNINESPDLDNITLSEKGFQKRTGDVAFNTTAMNSGVAVQGLTYFKPISGEFIVSVCGDKLYKSDSLDGTMDDITGGLTIAASKNNIWTFSKLKDLCVGVGGAPSVPFKYSGAGDGAALGGTPPNGSFCFGMRDRIFIGGTSAAPTTIYWSILANPEDWSGTGSGNNSVVTNDGDKLVGGIPVNNNLALLFKQYSIHQLVVEASPFPVKPLTYAFGACGKNAIVNAGGMIYFITKEPRMRVTDGYSFTEAPNSINNILDAIPKDRLEYIQGIYVPSLNQIHWYVSYETETTNGLCLIWDLYRKCWLRCTTGFACNVACIVQGSRLFGGHYNGKIYEKYKASTLTDASSGVYSGYWKTPWVIDGNPMAVKQPRYMDISFKTQTIGNVYYSYGFNYTEGQQNGRINQVEVGGVWDDDMNGLWDDTFVWGGQSNFQKRVFTYGRGNNFQLKIYNDQAGQPMEINSATIALKEQGIKEIANV